MENTNITVGSIGTAKVGRNEVTVKVIAVEADCILVESISSHRQFKTRNLTLVAALRSPEPPTTAEPETTEPEAPKGKPAKEHKETLLDRAAQVLSEAGEALTCAEIIAKLKAEHNFELGGATPKQTLYSAFFRDIENKGKDSRFRKSTERKAAFELNPND